MDLRLKKLKCHNFMNIENCDLNLDHNKILFVGNNGEGKSATIDAINLCLSSQKRSNMFSEFIRQGCDSAQVELWCEINGEGLYFNLNINKNCNSQLTYKGKVYKNSEIQLVLEKFSLDYYSDIIFSSQHEVDITSLNPARRAEYLKNVFNFSFEEKKIILKDLLDKNRSRTLQLENSIITNKRLITQLESQKESLHRPNISEDLYLKTLKEIESDKNELKQIQKDNDYKIELSEQLSELNAKIAKQSTLISNCEKDIVRSQELEARIQAAHYTIDENNGLVEEAQQTIKLLEESKDDIDKELKSLPLKIDSFNSLISYQTTKVHDIKNFIKLIEAEKCPTCGRETTEFMEAFWPPYRQKLLEKPEIANVLKGKETLKEACTLIESVLKDTKNKLDSQTNDFTQTNIKKAQINNKMNSHIDSIKNWLIDIEKYTEFLKRTPEVENDYEGQLQTLMQDQLAYKEQLACKTKEYNNLDSNDSAQFISNEIVKKTKIVDEYLNLITNNEKIKERNAHLQKQIVVYSESLITIESDINKNKIELSHLEEQFKIIDKDLPNWIIVKVCKELQDSINDYIAEIFPMYQVTLQNEKKGCTFFYTKDASIVDEKKNKYLNTSMSSGFEKALLTIQFKRQLASLYGISLFVCDEIDKMADSENSRTLYESLIKSGFSQLILITHKDIVKEYFADFDDSIFYNVKNGKFTTIL